MSILNYRDHRYFYYVAVVAGTLLFFWNGGYIHTSIAWMLEVRSIVEDGDIDLTNNWDCTPDEFGKVMYGCIYLRDGKAFTKYPPGRSLYLVPSYAVVHYVRLLLPKGISDWLQELDPEGYWVLKNTATFMNILATTVASLLVVLSVQALGHSFAAGVFGGLAYAFGTSMFTYTASTLIEPISTMWIALGLYLWIRYRGEDRTTHAIGAYLAYSLAFLASPQSILFMLCCLLFNLAEMRYRIAIKGLIAAVVPICLYCAHNALRSGAVLATGYTRRELVTCLWAIGILGGLSVVLGVIKRLTRKSFSMLRVLQILGIVALCITIIREPWDFFGFSVSPTTGMLVYSPVVAIAPFGLLLIYRGNKTLGIEIAMGLCILFSFLMAFHFEIDFILARFTSGLLPALCVAAAVAAARIARIHIGPLLAIVGFLMQLLVSVDNVSNCTFWGILEPGVNIPAYPKFLFWHYSLLRYKLLRLGQSLPLIPQFLRNPGDFDNTLFFNSYWFIVYIQELPRAAIFLVMTLLAGIASFSAVRLWQIGRSDIRIRTEHSQQSSMS